MIMYLFEPYLFIIKAFAVSQFFKDFILIFLCFWVIHLFYRIANGGLF